MNRAIARLCIFVGAVSILSGCGAPGPIGVTRSLSVEDQQPTATGWKIKFEESGSNPVIVDGVLYVGSADGAVYALDPTTGETKWRFQTGESLSPATSGPSVITLPRGTSTVDQMTAGIKAVEKQRSQGMRRVGMTPAVENGTVFIGSGDHSFYAIDATTGRKKWSYLAGPGMTYWNRLTRPAAVLENGTVYFVTEDGLHALDALAGERKWLFETLQEVPKYKYPQPQDPPEAPIVGDGVIFLTAWARALPPMSEKSFLYAVDPESGKSKWVTSVADSWDITAPATAKGLVFFAVRSPLMSPSQRETLYAVNAVEGKVTWKVDAEAWYGTPQLLIADKSIYFRTGKSLLALELGENWGQVLQSNISRRGVGLLDGLSFDSPLSSFISPVSLI